MKYRLVPAAVAAALVFAACGGSDSADDTSDTEVETPVETDAETDAATDDFIESEGDAEADATVATDDETVVDATDDAAESDPATEESVVEEDGEVGEASAAGAVTVALVEWALEAPTEYGAGDVTFTAVNEGGFPHELVVIEAESYETLPLDEGGAVLEDELPTGALLGRTSRLGGGSSEDLTVTLVPGNYVLVCNLGAGANSHAGQGQRLDITVS